MLSTIAGVVRSLEKQSVVIEVAGIGFEIMVPANTMLAIGESASLYTYLHWNQEIGPSLYGFVHEFEKKVFLLVISCSGMGPKIGLAVIAHLGPKAFLDAVVSGNHEVLSAVPGIGEKKAEQMIVQLRHKVEKLIAAGMEGSEVVDSGHMPQVAQVLTSLNYTRQEIARAMRYVQEACEPSAPFDKIMRQALAFLAKKS